MNEQTQRECCRCKWNSGNNGKSPNDYSVTLPTTNSTISIQVKWTNPSTAKALIQIVSEAQVKKLQNMELINNSKLLIASFSGDCMIFVVKYNYSFTTAGGKKYYFVSENSKKCKRKSELNK